jgi:hypothetical protein
MAFNLRRSFMRIAAIQAAAKLAVACAIILTGVAVTTVSASASTSSEPSMFCSALPGTLISGTPGNKDAVYDVSGSGCTITSGTPSVGSSVLANDPARTYLCNILNSLTDSNGTYTLQASDCQLLGEG